MMYNKLNEFLLDECTIDSWYDDGFSYAQEILTDFTKDDWEKLSKEVLLKPLEWQKKLVYCLDNEVKEEELNVLAKIITTKDSELFEMCVDTLRSFNNELGYKFLKLNPELLERVKTRSLESGVAAKKILEDFINKFI